MGDAINFKTVTFLTRIAPVVVPGFTSSPQSDLATEENASHFALVVALVCGQSRDFRVCRRVNRRVHYRARVRVGVFCT